MAAFWQDDGDMPAYFDHNGSFARHRRFLQERCPIGIGGINLGLVTSAAHVNDRLLSARV